MKLRYLLCLCSSPGLLSLSVVAQDAARSLVEKEPYVSEKRLGFYYPSSLNLVIPVGENDLEDTEHLELYLSVKYGIYDRELSGRGSKYVNRWFVPDRLDYVHNARYDLYAFGGEDDYNSPLVSRDQNPGLLLSFDHRYSGGGSPLYQRLELGVFHQSNARPDEASDMDLNNNGIDDALDHRLSSSGEIVDSTLEAVSRDWNYVLLAATYGSALDGKVESNADSWWNVRAEARLYFGERQEDIWWVDLRDEPRISEYDGIRLTAEYACKLRWFGCDPAEPNLITRLELKTGIGGWEDLDNLTYAASLNYRLNDSRAWLNLSYFDGYGKDNVTYHRESQFIGLGVTLR
ncbi:hypothetical protein SAMN02745181_3834 [Rubritalea squalenifaciens DSM 18772]|uniref:Phosphatidylcholine 1-acylhydrolase n=1 Tax=Rubritalea squalenifaciens DSM 18772 TaxID=1123071 RepID=A0A1M6SIC6_9BACT|nr:hypothetical protein [Rubritalea squalenifaciens]SHK44463.1 hypothetical protein SAMN02745181_3834 [Rubritalea squalenifaciens DSM 18772]